MVFLKYIILHFNYNSIFTFSNAQKSFNILCIINLSLYQSRQNIFAINILPPFITIFKAMQTLWTLQNYRLAHTIFCHDELPKPLNIYDHLMLNYPSWLDGTVLVFVCKVFKSYVDAFKDLWCVWYCIGLGLSFFLLVCVWGSY